MFCPTSCLTLDTEFNISELNDIDFEQVLETSSDTVRKSVDGTKTFVKWEETMPTCVSNLTTKEGPYSYSEILIRTFLCF